MMKMFSLGVALSEISISYASNGETFVTVLIYAPVTAGFSFFCFLNGT